MRPWFAVLALTACGDVKVGGSLGGETPDFREALFTVRTAANGDKVLALHAVGYRDACETLTSLHSALKDNPDASGVAELYQSHLPPSFWSAEIQLRAESLASVEGLVAEGSAWNSLATSPGQFSGRVIHYLQPLDEDWWQGTAPVEEYVARWWMDGGTLQVAKFEADSRIVVDLDTGAVEMVSSQADGELSLRIRAERCHSLEALNN